MQNGILRENSPCAPAARRLALSLCHTSASTLFEAMGAGASADAAEVVHWAKWMSSPGMYPLGLSELKPVTGPVNN